MSANINLKNLTKNLKTEGMLGCFKATNNFYTLKINLRKKYLNMTNQ